MNQDISLRDLLLVPYGPPEAVWRSALDSAFNSVDQPNEAEIQPVVEPEYLPVSENAAAVGSDSGTVDDLISIDDEVATEDDSRFEGGSVESADSISDPDEVSSLSGNAGEGYDY